MKKKKSSSRAFGPTTIPISHHHAIRLSVDRRRIERRTITSHAIAEQLEQLAADLEEFSFDEAVPALLRCAKHLRSKPLVSIRREATFKK